MEYKINLSNTENKDLISYCNLNDLRVSEVIKKSYIEGFNIERYGLLNIGGTQEKQVEKEVIVEKLVEIPVEVIREVVKIEYVEVEKPVETIVEKEIIKEVIKEVLVDKIVYVTDEQEMAEKMLQKEQEFEQKSKFFSTKIEELQNIFQIEKNELLFKIQQLELKEPEIKEIVVEKESSNDGLKSKLDALQNTVQKLKQDNINKDRQITEYQKTIEEIQNFQQDKRAAFLKGSNLDDTLYK